MSPHKFPIRILSIDPGYERLGVAVIEKSAPGAKEKLLYSHCVRTSAKLSAHERLHLLGKAVSEIASEYEPRFMALESLFFTKNQKTAMLVAEARGVILYEGACAGLEIKEYTPLQIKAAITGYGRSDKHAMMNMIPHLIDMKSASNQKTLAKKLDDEFDAIAVGLTFFARERF